MSHLANLRAITPKGGVAHLREVATKYGRASEEYKAALKELSEQAMHNIQKIHNERKQ